MTHLVERVRQVSEQPDGGAVVVGLPAGDPLALFQASVRAVPQLGFVPVLASRSGACDLETGLLQRHVLIVCADDAGVRTAIRWVRALAMASPRRHVIVQFGPLPPEQETAGAADDPPVHVDSPLGDRTCPRLARAERWLRRGRTRAAERWLVAAAHAARRRGDADLAALVERHVISRLLDVDRVAEAAARTRTLLRLPAEWAAYAEAAALWAAVLISRQSFAEARAWLISLLAEAHLRGAAVPTSVRTRATELAFWQGRSSPVPPVAFDQLSLHELGWSAMAAWSHGNLPRLTMLTARLAAMREPDDVASDLWFLLCRLFTASAADREDIERRVHAVLAAVRGCLASGRFRRLALAVCKRALIGLGHRANAKALFGGARGAGPEATVIQGRLARGQAPGIRFLIAGSTHMHVIDGLSGLLAVIEDSEDDVAVLTGGCRWVCRQAGATAVAVVSADGATLVAADGWRRAGPLRIS